MKVVAFNGSPNPRGNTRRALEIVLSGLADEGVDGEIVQVGGSLVHGCTACRLCFKAKNRRCAKDDDCMNDFIAAADAADGIIIGTPVYFSNVTSETKALIDRLGFVARANGCMLRHKVGAPVIAVRRAGSNFVYAAINFFFGINEMVIPCASYWNAAFGLRPGEVDADTEGIATLQSLARNMSFVLRKLNA
ncbi:MAG: flavodoxin family protein [Firmicutes bacterium]|jgi:multimeric flavodoxin WrbA|nr:flavodoxin family protein [Bacillota bacterium]